MIISRRITPNGGVNEADTVEIKTVLNRLGFYPVPKYGLTPYPDEAMFEGIAAFQKSRGIPATQAMCPGGKTHAAFETALAQRGGTRSAAGGGSGGMVEVNSYSQKRDGKAVQIADHQRRPPGSGGGGEKAKLDPQEAFDAAMALGRESAEGFKINPDLVENAGIKGVEAVLGAESYRHLNRRERMEVMKSIEALKKNGHARLAGELRAAIAEQNAMPAWNIRSLSEKELQSMIDSNERLISTFENPVFRTALSGLSGLPGMGKVAGTALEAGGLLIPEVLKRRNKEFDNEIKKRRN